MRLGHQHVFETKDPPGGGLAKLRSRLDAERRGLALRGRALWVGATGAVAACAVLLVTTNQTPLSSSSPAPLPGRGEMAPSLVALGMEKAPSEPVSVPDDARGRTVVKRVELPVDDVVFYLVAGTTSEAK